MIKGGDIGTAIIPGDPAASLMIKAVGYEGDLKMPPKGKLNAKQIADLSSMGKDGRTLAHHRSGGSERYKIGLNSFGEGSLGVSALAKSSHRPR